MDPASVNELASSLEILDEVSPSNHSASSSSCAEANWSRITLAHARAFRDSVTPILGTPY